MLYWLTSHHNSCLCGWHSLLLELVIKRVCVDWGVGEFSRTWLQLLSAAQEMSVPIMLPLVPLLSDHTLCQEVSNWICQHTYILPPEQDRYSVDPKPTPLSWVLTFNYSFVLYSLCHCSQQCDIRNDPWVTSWFIYFVMHSKAAPLCLAESQKPRQRWSVFSMFSH